jgi:hypothetical protein
MKTFHSGEVLRASKLEALQHQQRIGGTTLAGGGLNVQQTDSGTRVALSPDYSQKFRGVSVTAINNTGAKLVRGECVVLTGIATPGDIQYRGAIVYLATKPTDTGVQKIAVCLGDVSDHSSGLFCISGQCMAKITGASGGYVTPVAATTTLALSASGPIPVIWSDATAGWAEVRLGAAGSAVTYNITDNDGE